MIRRCLVAAAGGVVAGLLLGAGAQAQTAHRVWVSGHGVDGAGCGAPAAPCRSLQYAHDHVAAGGEIDVLDPAGYGALTISKAVSIVNDGVGVAGVQATSGSAITIAAGAADAVFLKGLTLDGVGGAGDNGIAFDSGAALTVVGCVARHFGQNGILLAPTFGSPKIEILDTISSDNTNAGVMYFPSAGAAATNGLFDDLVASHNGTGMFLDSVGEAGIVQYTLTNVVAANNVAQGVAIDGNTFVGFVFASIDSSHLDMNGQNGLYVQGDAEVHLSKSYISGNGGAGIANNTQSTGLGDPGGSIRSAGDNHNQYNVGALSGQALLSDPLD